MMREWGYRVFEENLRCSAFTDKKERCKRNHLPNYATCKQHSAGLQCTTLTKKMTCLTRLIKEVAIQLLIDKYFDHIYKLFPKFQTLVVPPLTVYYTTVGTAYDYLIRMRLEHEGSGASESLAFESRVVTSPFIASLCESQFTDKYKEEYAWAMTTYKEYLSTGLFTRDLAKCSLILSKGDVVYREGSTTYLDSDINEDVIEELCLLWKANEAVDLAVKEKAILNPNLGIPDIIVADCDLIIDNSLYEIKTTKELTKKKDHFRQLIGYYTLILIHKERGNMLDVNIDTLAIYNPRCCEIIKVPLEIEDHVLKEYLAAFKQVCKII